MNEGVTSLKLYKITPTYFIFLDRSKTPLKNKERYFLRKAGFQILDSKIADNKVW